MTEHTNKQFDAEMEAIRTGVLSMGGIVEQQMTRAIDALEKEEDPARIDAVGADEAAINQLQIDLDQQCAQIIARRQPTAIDLRMVLTVSKIVTDLERIGDEVKDKLRQSGMALSGGQQQRLCIARAIAVRPEVLLLDEPTSALDPISTAHIEELITELKTEYTIAIVTHNMQQAARVSDRTAYMYLGELMEFGATDQIFLRPARKETEDYITGRFG